MRRHRVASLGLELTRLRMPVSMRSINTSSKRKFGIKKAGLSKRIKRISHTLTLNSGLARKSESLSDQIVNLLHIVKLKDDEVQKRNEILEILEDVRRSYLTNYEYEMYGSFESGLSLFFSDIDLRLISTFKTDSSNVNVNKKTRSLRRLSTISSGSENSLLASPGANGIDNMMLNFFGETPDKQLMTNHSNNASADMMCITRREALSCLRKLRSGIQNKMKKNDFKTSGVEVPFTHIELRSRCRVPIINLTTKYGFGVDISVKELVNSPNTTPVVQKLSDWLFFTELAMILKLILQRKGLNKGFAGGLSSFNLYVLVASFLSEQEGSYLTARNQYFKMPEDNRDTFKADLRKNDLLGKLLLDFFIFCSRRENFSRDSEFSIESLDIGFGHLTQITRIREAFDRVHKTLGASNDLLLAIEIRNLDSIREQVWAASH